ncbi:uncharacterized protein LOC121416575 [Lytechinus variegatus]|uniref:uncharacterized protein LOC121416575 n=1 Tax=Lytechinus variegatus TaxID=7654 RepID=UPI001BB0EDE9|nr:uncharacterized protein LOC121416575 [Lytechinus variegatus]
MKYMVPALLIISFLGVTSAYHCWVCDSENDYFDGATCADPFFKGDQSLAKQQCSGDCFKEVSTDANGNKKYRRGCDACTEGCTTVGSVTTCRYCCYGMVCNGATNVRVNLIAAIVTSSLATLYYFC